MPRKKFNEEDYERWAEMRERGMSCEQIGRAVHASASVVSYQCLRLGADPPNAKPVSEAVVGPLVMARGNGVVRRFTPEDDVKLKELALQGVIYSEIGRVLGRQRNSIEGRLMTLARRERRKEEAA